MKLSQKSKEWILYLKNQGFGSRHIASLVGCSKSTVNNFLSTLANKSSAPVVAEVETIKVKTPNILLFDLETSADIVATFGRKNINISESNIIKQGNTIVSAAWKWYGSDKVETSSVRFNNFEPNLTDEFKLLLKIREQLEKADIIVIHNARFDLGTIQHRFLAHNLGKIPTVKVVDTLQIARKYLRLRSNKLDAITKYFGLSNKMENEGISLWIKTQSGCKQSLNQMIEYNKQDVVALEAVFKTFQPLSASANIGLISGNTSEPACPSCGSKNVAKTGKLVHTGVSSFEEYSCDDCGARSRGRKNVANKSTALLLPIN